MRTALLAFVMSALPGAALAEQVWLTMDYVRTHKLDRPAANIIVGNPSIADVSVRDAENLLLFGKGPGVTNILITDENGELIEDMTVRVRTQAAGTLSFYRGSARTTYSCLNNCEATVTVGDDQGVFSGVSAQVQQKFGQAQAAGATGGIEN